MILASPMPPCRAALLVVAAFGCARATRPGEVVTRRPSPPAVVTPTATRDASVPSLDAGLPPLFARKVRCVTSAGARSFARTRARDGGFALTPLTHDEVIARPWLWGQYPSGCTGWSLTPQGATDAAVAHDPLAAPTLRERVATTADVYLGWGRVDDYQRWAPVDCLLPPASRPQADLDAGAPHGRKVYYLYALDRAAYLEHRDVARQVVVKEAWAPESVPSAEAISMGYPAQCAVERDGTCVQPGAFVGLFVMLRGERAPDTDDGWTYATVDPRGDITALGNLPACARCHRDAPHGRLFGIPSGAAVRWR